MGRGGGCQSVPSFFVALALIQYNRLDDKLPHGQEKAVIKSRLILNGKQANYCQFPKETHPRPDKRAKT